METSTITRPRENYLIWGIKVIAGLLMVLLLGLHFIVNHLTAPEGLLTYADVLAYYQIPIIPIVEVSFLIVVVVHALLGVRSILLDLHLPLKCTRIMDRVLIAVGILLITYGTWLVIRVIELGRGS